MSALGRTRAWLRAVILRPRMEREMHEEMSAHIAQAAERFSARGMSARDAMLAARREFGQVGALQEQARDARGGQWIESMAGDLKYALRHFARMPLTTITIVLTLALGIGFSSAVFSVIHGILTKPAPGVPDDPALVKIRGLSDVQPYSRRLSYPELATYAALADKFESVAGWVPSRVVVDLADRELGVMSTRALFVTPNYFRTIGVRLAAGRGFGQSAFDELYPPELTAVVDHGFAIDRFGGAREAVGKQLKVNDVAITIIGVAPPRFYGAVQAGETRTFWMPLSAWALVARASNQVTRCPGACPPGQAKLAADDRRPDRTDPDAQSFEGLGRLRPGVSMSDAEAAVRVVAARENAAARARTGRVTNASSDLVPLRGIMDVTGRYDDELGPGLILFSAIALLILAVCTTTVNSLLVGAAVARRYEIGVRLALGASRGRIVRQLLTEVSLLALAGGALGLWGFGTLSRLIEVAKDGFDVSPDWTTMTFMFAYALLTATLCGLSPALHATRAGLSEVIKDSAASTRGRSRLQRAFVIAQIAVAQPLMIGLAAVIASAVDSVPASGNVPLRDRLLFAEFDTYTGFSLTSPDRIPGLVRRIAEIPGVVTVLPLGYGVGQASLEVPSSDSAMRITAPTTTATVYDVPPGYFAVVDAPIVRGREFVPGDTTLAVTPVILAESLAVALFKARDPIGARVLRVSAFEDRPVELEVVGVVRMNRETNSLEYPSDLPPVFVPLRRQREGRLLIRTNGPAELLMPIIRDAAQDEARMLPLTRMRTLAQGDRIRRSSRLEVVGIGVVCGVVALVLASIGLYAMLSVAVGQRRREIGIRAALGAQARQVVAMFFRGGIRVTLIGLAIGLPLSGVVLAALMRFLGLPWGNVPALAALVAVAVVGVASLASWLPSRRAAGVDPIVALRSD